MALSDNSAVLKLHGLSADADFFGVVEKDSDLLRLILEKTPQLHGEAFAACAA